jgi:hypothetical protein
MDTSIITTIIGGACTVGGSVLTIVVKSWLDRKQSIFKSISGRRDAIAGHWVGTIYQAEGPYGPPIEFDVEFHLLTDSTSVKGDALFEWEERSIIC